MVFQVVCFPSSSFTPTVIHSFFATPLAGDTVQGILLGGMCRWKGHGGHGYDYFITVCLTKLMALYRLIPSGSAALLLVFSTASLNNS